jgi:hypothetical protein
MRVSNRLGGHSGLQQRTDLARVKIPLPFEAHVNSLLNIAVHEGGRAACRRALRAMLEHHMIRLPAMGVFARPYLCKHANLADPLTVRMIDLRDICYT